MMKSKLTSNDAGRALEEMPTAYIADAMGRLGLEGWLPGLVPRGATRSTGCFVGSTITVQWAQKQGRRGRKLDLYEIIRTRTVEQMLVIVGGNSDCYLLGDNIVAAAKLSGFQAILVEGCIRDSIGISQIDIGVFSTGIEGGHPSSMEVVAYEIPVMFRGQWVEPGDVIAADSDGAIVFPADRSSEILEEARDIQALEREQGELISRGGSLEELANLLSKKEQPGVR